MRVGFLPRGARGPRRVETPPAPAGRPADPWLRAALLGAALARPARAEEATVVVRGASAPSPPPKDPSLAGSVIRGERLRAPGLRVAELLRTQPGVGVAESGGYGALSTATVRGATAAQTPVYLGGVRLNDDVAGTADLSLVPLWLTRQVEIYRGHAPLQADRLGIGGAIFFEPRRPRGPEAGAGLMAGSFGARAGWGYVGLGGERAAALAGARFERADNDYAYRNDLGTRFDPSDERVVRRRNADASTWDIWSLGTTALGGGARADLLVNATAREQGLPGLSLFATERARASLRRTLAALRAEAPCGPEGRCALVATTSVLFARAAYDDPLGEAGLGAARSDVGAERVEQALLWRQDVGQRVSVSAAARASVEALAVDGGGRALDARRATGQASISGEWLALRHLTLRALGGLACNGTGAAVAGAAGPSRRLGPCDERVPSARLGAQVGEGSLVALANAGRYARLPTLGELYGVSGVVRGNEGLVEEVGLTADVGARASGRAGPLGEAYLDAFAFVRSVRDLVGYRRSSLGYVVPYNVGRARVAGLEAALGATPLPFLQAELSLTLLDPRDTTPGRDVTNDVLPFQSRLTLAPRVRAFRGPLPRLGLSSASLSASYLHQASRYADPAGLVVLPAQGSFDLEAEVELLGRHIAVRARAANLFDQARFDLVGYPLPGRAAYLALEARWLC
ncbi:MAG TPA: TonB-dependent receptor [Polyangiaceae bacterium]|nr:TonB-dependent receptor [Polyangiaceae bacterium]